ncbi:gamma-glutamylcyclotransferase [Paracoccaceae bacterium]|nr:gamma-glutamylcyclotransferase [Paracoccaceae bacterium]
MQKFYLAYGSNLNHQQMAKRCPNADFLGSSMLKDWRLIFKSVATIEKEAGKDVPVGVFQITDSCEKALDIYEDYPKLYNKQELDVILDGKRVTAMTYIMVAKYGIAPPSKKYFNVISEGYKNCDLNSDFLLEAEEYSIKADSGKGYESTRWNQ